MRYHDCAGFKECESERNKFSFDSKGYCKYCVLQGTAMQGNILLFVVTRRRIFFILEFISVYINQRRLDWKRK